MQHFHVKSLIYVRRSHPVNFSMPKVRSPMWTLHCAIYTPPLLVYWWVSTQLTMLHSESKPTASVAPWHPKNSLHPIHLYFI